MRSFFFFFQRFFFSRQRLRVLKKKSNRFLFSGGSLSRPENKIYLPKKNTLPFACLVFWYNLLSSCWKNKNRALKKKRWHHLPPSLPPSLPLCELNAFHGNARKPKTSFVKEREKENRPGTKTKEEKHALASFVKTREQQPKRITTCDWEARSTVYISPLSATRFYFLFFCTNRCSASICVRLRFGEPLRR